MKLLLDQNLSSKLENVLRDVFPGTLHVRSVGLHTADDFAVWQHAKQHDFVVASKDSDMVDLCTLRGAPPKVLWIRLGNCSTALVQSVLVRNYATIHEFVANVDTIHLSLFRYDAVR